MSNNEQDFSEALSSAQTRVKKLFDKNNQSYSTLKDLMIWTIAEHRQIGFFSNYFSELTDEDICFEALAIKEFQKIQEPVTQSDVIENTKKNIEKVQSEFDDWKEEDSKEQSDENFLDNAMNAWDALAAK